MTSVRYQKIAVDGTSIFYRQAGPTGAPKLLLLHGFPTSSHMFRDLIPLLADHYYIVAPDLPGFGLSDLPGRGLTFDRIAQTVDRFTEVVGLDVSPSGTLQSVQLKSGGTIACLVAVNSTGYHARTIAAMAGIDLPVHPRKRFVYVFDCRDEIENVPLTIDPTGAWFRPEGTNFICGISPEDQERVFERFYQVERARSGSTVERVHDAGKVRAVLITRKS